jgi:hypothetical protein
MLKTWRAWFSLAGENQRLGTMSKKTAQQPIAPAQTNQTPFERFQDATKKILAVPKKDLPEKSKS